MRDKTQRIAQIEAEIAQLAAQRGAPGQPVALDARLGQLQRTLRWYQKRLDPPHPNTGTASVYERSGRSRRDRKLFDVARDYPAVTL